MNKKLMALAVAAALAPAAAMADTGNVTVYGVLDASYDMTNNGNSTSGAQGTRTNKVSSNSSRIGFKGTEDLGNGTSAVWQIETGVNMDGTNQTTQNLNSRNTFVGLSNKGMGTVIMGRHDTPYKLATRSLDMFGDGLADNRNLMGFGGASFDGRQSDVVAYISPNFSGFHAAVAYVAGAEGAATSGDKKGNAWSMMGMYENGPWMGSLAYERHNYGNAPSSSLTNPAVIVAGTAVGAGALADREEHAWKLGVGYKTSQFRVGFAYERTSDDFGNATPALTTACGGSECLGHNAWTLGGGYTIGTNEIKLAYTKSSKLGTLEKTDAKQWAIGLDHNMSKRTKVYAQYVRLDNSDNIGYGLTGAGSGSTGGVAAKGAGADPSAWSFGIRHTF